MSFSFETDRDVLRPVTRSVTYKALASGIATLTTSVDHGFAAGWSVTITGVDAVFDGTYVITEVTNDTLSFSLSGTDVPSTVATGYVTSPSNAYLRFSGEGSTVLDDLAANTDFHAEPWDYDTVRVFWNVTSELHAKALQALDYGLVPRVAITRSTFGYPSTPLDGDKVLDVEYTVGVASPDTLGAVSTFETQLSDPGNDFDRPVLPGVQSLYDRNLISGVWYYYTLFVMAQEEDAESSPLRWYKADTTKALVPINYEHGRKLYELIPPYYRAKDVEFTPGTGRDGVLKRLIDVVGFEADYTRTLAEGIEHSYDIDKVADVLLSLLGETNMGVTREDGLGDIRYRSIVAAINRLYNERGSASGLQKLTLAASKYNCKVIEGVNKLCLPDDAEFLSGTGSWGDLTSDYGSFLAAEWPADTFNPASLTLTTETGGPLISQLRRGAVQVTNASGSASDALLLACGLGTGERVNRLHDVEVANFYPRLHGIRCTPGLLYTFSFYSRLISGTPGIIGTGILWFDAPENNAAFDIDIDYLGRDETSDLVANDSVSTTLTRHSVQSVAPYSALGRPYIYAVPYIHFANSSPRNVTACMFNTVLNDAADVAIEPDVFLTLGTSELIGDETIFLGDPA